MANASEILENLSKTFSRTADKVAKKTDELISVQKVKNRKNGLERQMNATYISIGKSIFDEYVKGNPLSEDIVKNCEKIQKLQKEISACVSEIEDIKAAKDVAFEDVDFFDEEDDPEEEEAEAVAVEVDTEE